MADPSSIQGLEVAFLNNQQDPTIEVQDQATVGWCFTNDQITYKERHEYGGTEVDHKALYASFPS